MLHLRRLVGSGLVVAGLLAVAVIAAACGGDGEEEGTPAATVPPSTGEEEGPTLDVVMRDNLFEPATLTVEAGQTVAIRVENRGSAIHNLHVAGADNLFDEGGDDVVSDPDTMRGGDTGELSVTLDQPGAYRFRCDFHPSVMTGEIVVE